MYRAYVLIATCSPGEDLFRTLDSVAECEKPDGFAGVLLVENGVATGVRDRLLERYRASLSLEYHHAAEANKSAALNLAMEFISDPEALVIFIDDDVTLHGKVLSSFAAAARRSGPGHYFGGPVGRLDPAPRPARYLVPLLPLSVAGWSPRSGSRPLHFLGYNWAAFVRDLLEAGGFDERFGPGSDYLAGGQETEMQNRLLRDGVVPVFVRDALVHHRVAPGAQTLPWLLKRSFRIGGYKGLTPRAYGRADVYSFEKRTGLAVVERSVRPRGIDAVRCRIARLACQAAEAFGFVQVRIRALCKQPPTFSRRGQLR